MIFTDILLNGFFVYIVHAPKNKDMEKIHHDQCLGEQCMIMSLIR